MSDAHSGGHPPKPHFALSIGVVGHRPNRLRDLGKVEAAVNRVIDEFAEAATRAHSDHQNLFATGGETLTLVSALAEGADRMAAKAALARGFKLDVPIPFPREEYAKDFVSEGSVAEFESLIERARSVIELPGTRRSQEGSDEPPELQAGRAYEAAGLTVLSQSDILLVVWDGHPSQGRGGTPELIAEAARIGLPIILVDAAGTEAPELRWRNFRNVPAPIVHIEDVPHEKFSASLHKVLDTIVRAPTARPQKASLARWFEEKQYRRNLHILYPVLLSILRVRPLRSTDLFPSPVTHLAHHFERPARRLVGNEKGAGSDDTTPHGTETDRQEKIRAVALAYGWADYVATGAAQVFRSAFVFNFLFAALAVVLAASAVLMHGSAHEQNKSCDIFGYPVFTSTCLLVANNWVTVLELLFIFLVVGNTAVVRWAAYHRRWYEGRELAERLRVALPLWAVGLRPGFFVGEELTWTGWYARAVLRMQGLRHGELTGEGLRSARNVLLDVLQEQCLYNEVNARRALQTELCLERIGLGFIALTVLMAADHLAESPLLKFFGSPHPHELAIWLTVALPVLATASYGIRFIGDFEGIGRRAERTRDALSALITAVDEDADELVLLRARASSAADAMLGDVASWRLSAESRGLAIPG